MISANETRFWVIPEGGGTEMLHARFRDYRYTRHTHDRYVFGVIDDGVEGWWYRGAERISRGGQLAVVMPGELHDGYCVDEGGWHYRMAYIRPEALAALAGEIAGRAVTELPFFREPVFDDPWLFQITAAFHAASAETIGQSQVLARESLMTQAMAGLITRHSVARPPLPRLLAEPGVIRARDFLVAHHADPVPLTDLAAMAGLSPYHFLRCFHRRFGMPPHAFQTDLRLGSAERLLADGVAVAETAAACGFADQSHLTRAFKRKRGVTPGDFRSKFLQASRSQAA